MRKLRCDHCNHLEWPGHAWKRDDLTLCNKCWQVRREIKDPLVYEDSGAIRWDRKLMRWESVDLEYLPTWDPKTRSWVTLFSDLQVAQFIANTLRDLSDDGYLEDYTKYVSYKPNGEDQYPVHMEGWFDLGKLLEALRQKGMLR